MAETNAPKIICFTGHRSNKLPWKYDETKESCVLFKKHLKSVLIKAIENGFTNFISGMAIGVDTIAAELVIELRNTYKSVTLEGAIPCPGQESPWPQKARDRYKELLAQCDTVHYVSDHYTDTCMNDRNLYMVEKSDAVIAVWNGKPSGTGNTVRFAKEHGCKVKIINPDDFA